VYEVAKDFVVEGGPIASSFEQPGGGAQFKLRKDIIDLLKEGYLSPLNPQ
jgi:hypothetical protein